MGCERGREVGPVGFGGVRASVERRWLINAKSTVMRQRKWQEVRLQKELDEQRKKAEILEKRKQERARLAAYIHSAAQAPVKCATNGKHQRHDNKKLSWKTCLLRDHELLLKLRENAKVVAHNQSSKNRPSSTNNVAQGQFTCRMPCGDSSLPQQVFGTPRRSGEPNLCMNRNFGDLAELLEAPTRHGEAMAQNPLLEHKCVYQMQVPKRHALTAEISVNTSATWALNTIPNKANFVEEHENPSIFEMSKLRSLTSDNVVAKRHGSQPARSVLPDLADAGAQVASEVARCCVEPLDTNPEFASLEIAFSGTTDSAARRSNPDLSEEILKSRRVNEAATTRLIAQVTAIESRLDDCNMNWKSLCLEDDEVKACPATGPEKTLCAADDLNLVTNTNHSVSLERKAAQEYSSRVSGIKADNEGFPNLEGQQCAQHICKTKFLSSPTGEASNSTSCDTLGDAVTFGSLLVDGQAGSTSRVHRRIVMEGLQPFGHSHRNKDGFAFHQESLDHWGTASFQAESMANNRLVEQVKSHSECSSICLEPEQRLEASVASCLLPFANHSNSRREFACHQVDVKLVTESHHFPIKIAGNPSHQADVNLAKETLPCLPETAGNLCDIMAMKGTFADSMKESHATWKIDWNAAADTFPGRNLEDHSGLQSKYYSCIPNSAINRKGGEHLSSHQLQVPQLMDEPRQQVHTIGLERQGGEDHSPRRSRPCFATCDALGSVQIAPNPGQSFQDQYTYQDTNWTHSAGIGASMLPRNNKNCQNVEYSFGDKENHLESQRQSLLEEEEKIFASLDRLDWKLAAINLKSMNVARESAVSQGQYSTKSAPAIMGPPRCAIIETFSTSAKKIVQYSAIPPRPMTSQGEPILKKPNGRQRRQVGLTNKAGRMHNQNRKK